MPIDAVERTERPTAVTPVPRAPDWVRGVTSLRGEVITVIELNQLLNREGVRRLEDVSTLLVLTHQGRRLAIQSTSLPDFVRVTESKTMGLPPAEVDVYSRGIEVDGSLIGVLDLDKLTGLIERRLGDA